MKFLKIIILVYLALLVILFFAQNWAIFRVNPLPEGYEFKFKNSFEERFYTAVDGTEISTLFFPSNGESKGLVFYNHGNRRNMSRWGRSAELFTKHGYDVFLYDYRGFGKTKGSPSEKNIHADAAMLYAEMKKKYKEDHIIVYGRSLGSGVAAKLAADNRPKLLVLESAYYNMADVGWQHLPIFPYNLLIKHPFRTDQNIAKVKGKVYLIHGTEDRLIPYSSSLKLANKMGVSADSVLTSLPGGHRGLYKLDAYQAKWAEWLK